MRIIEHSTTPYGLVNSLSHSGTRFKKRTVRITAFLLRRMLYRQSVSPARLPYPIDYQGPQNFLEAKCRCKVRWLFALDSRLSFIVPLLTLSKQTAYHVLGHPPAKPHLQIIFTSPLTCFPNLVITNGSYRTSLGVYLFWPK